MRNKKGIGLPVGIELLKDKSMENISFTQQRTFQI